MIATEDRKTCRPDESLEDVKKRTEKYSESYDYLPVQGDDGSIDGFVEVARLSEASSDACATVAECGPGYEPLSGDDLVQADMSIREFLRDTDGVKPRLVVRDVDSVRPDDNYPEARLVVPDEEICGLVNSADLSKPAVGTALCAIILEFETAMIKRIRAKWGKDSEEWLNCLNSQARREVKRWYRTAQDEKRDVGLLLETTLDQEMTILRTSGCQKERVKRLRNDVFHAKSPKRDPAGIRDDVRTLLALQKEIEDGLRDP